MMQFTGFQTTFKATDEEKRNESNHDGALFSQTKLHVIYSICIAGLFVAMAICYVCIHFLKIRRAEQTQECNNQQNEIQNAPNISVSINENIASFESIYVEIDEVGLYNDDSLPTRHSNVSDESNSDNASESETENMQNDDYLNPYQPIVEDSNKHDYKTLNVSTNNLDILEDNSIVCMDNEEIPLKILSGHQYLDVIFDPRNEYPMRKCIASAAENGSRSRLHKKVQSADIVNKQKNENLPTSKLNRSHSNKDNPKEDKEYRKLSSSVPIKRLTI